MAKQGNYIKYIKYNGNKFIRKDSMTKKQQIEHLYNIVRDLSKRIDSLQNKKATVSWAAELKKRIETLENRYDVLSEGN